MRRLTVVPVVELVEHAQGFKNRKVARKSSASLAPFTNPYRRTCYFHHAYSVNLMVYRGARLR